MKGASEMARYIDAEKLIERSILTRTYKGDSCITVDDIDDCPTEDVAPVIHAKWIGKPIAGRCTVRCNYCRNVFLENNGKWKYCPNCGAEMEGEE